MEPALQITTAVEVKHLGEVFWAVNYIDDEGNSNCEIEYRAPNTPNIIPYPKFLEIEQKDESFYIIAHKINNEKVRIKITQSKPGKKFQEELRILERNKPKIVVANILPNEKDQKHIKKIALVFFDRNSGEFSSELSDSRMQVSSMTFEEALKLAKNIYTILGGVRKLFKAELEKT